MAEAPAIDASRAPASLWDRVSTWVSENKAIAYTIAGTVVVVTSAGAIYYFSTQKSAAPSTPTEKRKSKKERRKEKKAAEEAAKLGSTISLKDEEAGKKRLPHIQSEG
jgi:mitochondrial import receptor subunit TOM70